jgi:type IV pilus assembly protein PilQ
MKKTLRPSGRTFRTLTLTMAMLAGTAAALGQDQAPPSTMPTDQTPEQAPAPPPGMTPMQQMSAAAGNPPAPPEAPGAREPIEEGKVRVDDNMIVDLHVNDEDLGSVLEMLSIQSHKNIIASKNVSARVTANLYGVTFFEALDAILNVNGYGYIEEGNFITIYTIEELQRIRQAQRPRMSKVVKLNYLNATDAAELVKPLLSVAGPGVEAGQIKTNGRLANFVAPGDTPKGNEDYALGAMLVVYDYEENLANIEALVGQIDTRPQQVLVEATVLQTSLNEGNALGVDFSIIADADFSEFVASGPLGVVNTLINGRDTTGSGVPSDGGATGVVGTVGKTAAAGGLKIGIVSNDVAVFIRMLDEVTDTTIISNPKIMALNRQSSRVLVGRKVGYLSTTSTDTATTQTVQFLATGTQLYFRPIVQSDGFIRMELKPQVSEAVIREQTDASGAAVTIPDEITNELTTNVLVRDGQTVVLGGLFRESTKSSRSQVPLLGDIPLIGYAFRGQEDDIQRNEIIFMVTPHLMNDASLNEQAGRGKEYGDRALAGAREGTLFFSRDRLTGLLNIEAESQAAKGNTDRAMWYVQRSLAMNHAQPEVIALREKLTNKKTFWPSRSILQRVIDGETDTVLRKKPGTSMAEVTTPAPVEAQPVQQVPEAETAEAAEPVAPEVPEVPPVETEPPQEMTEVPEQPTPLPEFPE